MLLRRILRTPSKRCEQRAKREPLRCQFVITSMPVGGAETLLVNLMRQMDRSVIRPEVICLKERGPLGEQIAEEFEVHSGLIGRGLLGGKYDVTVIRRLAKLMRNTDAVVTVGAGDKMFWGRLAAFFAGVPVIVSALHSTGWPDGVGRLNRQLTPLTDAFIAVAQTHGVYLSEHEGFPSEKVHVIRNGVDCDRFRPDAGCRQSVRSELGLSEDAKLVGIVAALRFEKNHGMLVRCAAKLKERHPDLHWLIVGEGPERESIERLALELKVRDRLHLLGTRHDTPRLLASLDLFTLCSLNEASPVSILEAMACEVPVASADVGSVAETVLPDQTGVLFQSQDLEGMAAALKTMMGSEATRNRMGRAGRSLVMESGSLASMVAGYQQLVTGLYDKTIQSPGTEPSPLPSTSSR